jgi:hypothetical protein
MTRRRLLLVAGGISAAGAAVGVHYLVSTRRVLSPPDVQLEQYVAAGDFSPDLGARYLESQNLRLDAAHGFLAEAKEILELESDMHANVRRQIESDFVRGEICRLNGWHLSLTECRLAAIAFALQESGVHIEKPLAGPERPLDHLADASIAQVERWGPRLGKVSEPFNPQPGGASALWFQFQEIDRFSVYQVYLGAQAAVTTTNADKNLITARLSARQSRRLTSKEGVIPIHLVDPVRGKQLIGYFEVRP